MDRWTRDPGSARIPGVDKAVKMKDFKMKRTWLCGTTLMLLVLAGCSGSTDAQVDAVKTPSHLQGPEAIVYAAKGGDLATVKAVLAEDPSLIQAQDHMGNTLLHIAGGYNRLEVVQYLLEQGADPTAENFDGQNSFEYADSEGADPAVLDALRT